MTWAESMSIKLFANAAWMLGPNCRPLWAWPRKYPAMARMAPDTWRGTCHLDRMIWSETVSRDSKRQTWSHTHPQDHTSREDQPERQYLDGNVNPQYAILSQSFSSPNPASRFHISTHYRVIWDSLSFWYLVTMMFMSVGPMNQAQCSK